MPSIGFAVVVSRPVSLRFPVAEIQLSAYTCGLKSCSVIPNSLIGNSVTIQMGGS